MLTLLNISKKSARATTAIPPRPRPSFTFKLIFRYSYRFIFCTMITTDTWDVRDFFFFPVLLYSLHSCWNSLKTPNPFILYSSAHEHSFQYKLNPDSWLITVFHLQFSFLTYRYLFFTRNRHLNTNLRCISGTESHCAYKPEGKKL